jgi:hypothetical protein
MQKVVFAIAIVGTILVAVLCAPDAYAQATRTWVSGLGDDVNPCSRTSPCKTFAGAISKTAAGGEINVLDPGGFGAVTITKSISIISQFEAGVSVSGTNGIVVNAGPKDRVLLDGLDIEGLGTGLNGVHITSAEKVTIRKCSIRNFTERGVDLEGKANTQVYLQDSQIINNAGGGFLLRGASGATNSALIERTTFDLKRIFVCAGGRPWQRCSVSKYVSGYRCEPGGIEWCHRSLLFK